VFRIIIQLLPGCGGWLNSCAKKQGGDQHSNVEPNGQRHGGATQVIARELQQLVETSASKPRHFHSASLGCHFAATWVARQPRAVAEGVPQQLQLLQGAAASSAEEEEEAGVLLSIKFCSGSRCHTKDFTHRFVHQLNFCRFYFFY
jgi:hypothetical protein